MNLSRKKIIADNFGANINTYDKYAKIQNQVASRLCDMVSKPTKEISILEIGCGTGFLTEKLIKNFPDAHITVIDISQKMVDHCQHKFKNITAIQMDGETINFNQKFDLIISNMSVQWFENPVEGIRNIKNYLIPNGQLYYSTIGKNNFQEWKNTLNTLYIPNGLIKIPDYEDIVKEEILKENYNSAKEFIKFLQKIGAHHPSEGYKKLTPLQMKTSCSLCDQTYNGSISWHILYGHFQKT